MTGLAEGHAHDAALTQIERVERLLQTQVELLRQILEAVTAPAARQAATLSRADRAKLAALLPVLGAVYGAEGFTSRDCQEDDAPGLRLVVGQMSVKAIGKLLARAEGIAIDGLMVRRKRPEFHVIVWHVVAC